MFSAVLTGKMYNGRVAEWGEDRQLFAGRLNFRIPGANFEDKTKNYAFIDVVCFKDFGENGGLVAWLEKNFLAEDGPTEHGGQGIVLQGYLRPIVKKMTAKIPIKRNGKKDILEAPNTPYSTFEFVIESAEFPVGGQSEYSNKKDEQEPLEDDFDSLEIDTDGDTESEVEDTTEEQPKEDKKQKQEKKQKGGKGKQKQQEQSSDETNNDDEDFFNN